LSRLAVAVTAIVLLAGFSLAAVTISRGSDERAQVAGDRDAETTPQCLPANTPEDATPETESGELAGLRAELVTEGLTDPVDVMELPGWDLLLVAEKPGRVVALREGMALPRPVLDISNKVTSGSNERGLLTIEADPRFEDTCRLFLFFTDLDGDSNLVSATVQGGAFPTIDPDSMNTLLVVPQKQRYHQSGSLVFGPDGMLWVSIGDGGLGQEQNAQNPRTLEGSVIRIDVESGPYVASGRNPFGVEVKIPDTWSIGLRNPWRITIDPVERIVYVPDTGFETTEEINIAPMNQSGLNFGWPVTEGTECAHESGCDTGAFTLPIYYHPRGNGDCAMVGGVVYRGAAIPELQGHYFFGDFCSSNIRSLRYEEGTVRDVTEWKDDLDIDATMTSFGTNIAGEIYVTTLAGQLWKIAIVTLVGEVFDWLPLALAFLLTEDPNVIGASIGGAVVGSVWGAARERKRQNRQNVTRSVTNLQKRSGVTSFCTRIAVDRQVETKHRQLSKSEGVSVPIGKIGFSDREVTPIAFEISEHEIVETFCGATPPGWYCTRPSGHTGPFAAVPDREDDEPQDWRRAD